MGSVVLRFKAQYKMCSCSHFCFFVDFALLSCLLSFFFFFFGFEKAGQPYFSAGSTGVSMRISSNTTSTISKEDRKSSKSSLPASFSESASTKQRICESLNGGGLWW